MIFLRYLFLLFLIFGVNHTLAQSNDETAIEKVYSQTDRPFYFPGETIWFKSYVVSGDNTISTISQVMHAQLISPNGDVVKSIRLPIELGYAYGDFYIDEDWVGGMYEVRMFTHWMKNYGSESYFSKKITVQKVVKPNVLFSLEFEKEGYGKNSLVTADFEVKDLKNNPIQEASIDYVVTVKGNIIDKNINKTDSEGKAKISFQLPPDLNTKDVVLNVKINHKQNIESISRAVPIVLNNIDIQFLPESGKILFDVNNRIAFKAVNEFGKPVDVSGKIFDKNGQVVTTFESFHDGMGTFKLFMSESEGYYAQIVKPFLSEEKISLPKVFKKGVNFQIETDSSQTNIVLNNKVNQALFLEISTPNGILKKQPIQIGDKKLVIDTKNFPIGITTFKIMDEKNTPLAERLVFLNAHKKLNIDIEFDKDVYETREKVKAKLLTTDENGLPIPSNLSVSIVDNKLLSFADDKQDHILSYLLLSSDLKGKIHKPDFYFNPKEIKSKKALDYVMLTHGWRDYIYSPIAISDASHKPELKSIEYGTITQTNGKPIKANLLLFNDYTSEVISFKTDEEGYFSFDNDSGQSTTLIAYTDDGKNIRINKNEIISNKPNAYSDNYASPSKNIEIRNPSKSKLLVKQTVKKTASNNATVSFGMEEGEALDEVVVIGYGTSNMTKEGIRIIPLDAAELNSASSISDVLSGKIAGVQISSYTNSPERTTENINIRGSASILTNNSPLVIVDGVPRSTEILSILPVSAIRSISVLKNIEATRVLGVSSSGLILIDTKSNSDYYNHYFFYKKKLPKSRYKNYAIANFDNKDYNKFYKQKKFYIPKYESKELPKKRDDFRQTIYWNPVVQTDEAGKAEIEFYNSDAITSFMAVCEGVGANGLVGRKKKAFSTKKMLNVDFKLPNYMALNDTIVLSVNITNESNEDKTLSLDFQMPSEIKLLDFNSDKIVVKANSYC